MTSTTSSAPPVPRSPRARRRLRALFGLTAGALVLALPAVAHAAPRPAPSVSSASLCNGVSAGQISSVVGWAVSSPKASTDHSYFDKKLSIHESDVTCAYSASATTTPKGVRFIYGTLSKAPAKSAVLADIKGGFGNGILKAPKGMKLTYSVSTLSGVFVVTVLLDFNVPGQHFTEQILLGWQGTKVAVAVVFSPVAKSKLQALELLALHNFGM